MEKFETDDANLAATIVATIGAPLLGYDRCDPMHIKYFFFRDDVPEEFIESYERHDIRVEPAVFALAQRYLFRQTHGGFSGEAE